MTPSAWSPRLAALLRVLPGLTSRGCPRRGSRCAPGVGAERGGITASLAGRGVPGWWEGRTTGTRTSPECPAPPVQRSTPARSHLRQDHHRGFQHRCKMVYLAQRLQPGVKLASPSEAALLEYGSGGTPAAQTHLLLPECGGSKTICRHRSGPQEVSRGLHVLWTQALLTAAPARLGDGGVTWMSAQDRRSTALKLLRHMGPQQGQHCQQEGGKRSLPTFFPFSVAYPQQRFFLQTLRAGIQRSAHK